MSELNLSLDAFRKGDIKAYTKVYRHYFEKICLYVYKKIKNDAEAKDIANETLAALWNERAKFKDLAHIRHFLYIVARNRCIDYYRGQMQKLAFFDHVNATLGKNSTTDRPDYGSFRSALNEFLTFLSGQQRQIVELSMGGLSHRAIASLLEISYEQVCTQISRAKKKLLRYVYGKP
ncbi:MAG TPA: sigma-70 family RNA polymerase sigma factor [Puia sp.]|jgi:RNA polymerase sigma-70 factor (ECF subfamily)